MEQKRNLPTKESKTENQLLTRESVQLGIILHSKNSISLKQTAVILAPGGQPRFDLLISKQTSQISSWTRHYGKEKITEIVFFLVEDLNNYFNVSRPMTVPQMTELAIEIVQTLWWVKMEEIVAFFEAVKKQTYGKIYERIDPAVIWELWEAYMASRDEHCERVNTQYRQYDPRPEGGSGIGLDGISGAIGDIKERAKRLANIKDKGNGKTK